MFRKQRKAVRGTMEERGVGGRVGGDNTVDGMGLVRIRIAEE